MKKAVSIGVSLLGYELSIAFKIKAPGRKSLQRRNELIVHDYQRGHSIKILSGKYNLSENRIIQILNQHGVRQPKWHKITQQQLGIVLKLNKKGLSMAEIARQVGKSRERIRQIIQQNKRKHTRRVQVILKESGVGNSKEVSHVLG